MGKPWPALPCLARPARSNNCPPAFPGSGFSVRQRKFDRAFYDAEFHNIMATVSVVGGVGHSAAWHDGSASLWPRCQANPGLKVIVSPVYMHIYYKKS